MKISHEQAGAPTDLTTPATAVQTGQVDSPKPSVPPASGDQVTLSPEVRLLQQASEAALNGSPIRSDLVERMRAAIARGEQADVAQLADAIIDRWLGGV
jgi:flagellar biosynthesis anti-sigma factor FlgM